ncbi:AGE family epimerase/isomerase [Halorubrum vacuolatum]|uniref:Mannose or cellobiose epimerase, N-acyl-D-glucosamine 2-epimerase family n=1 Tax=Halorubrum vacuolatum TaxID=63740 RepID=A0A238WQM6_HALVU|nr:AGE family epimerase/isomerase [Halorubrum vacuolatum]SNR48554.1 Mannose or cellobiose epimerase, N-acyl-D-glucosamine 2-epimerase family [Halorubrum vacuolatum]
MGSHLTTDRRARLLSVLRVQYPDALADHGFQLLDPVSGEPYSNGRRHLVATCRSISNFALGALVDGPEWCLDAVDHGLQFLRAGHRRADGGYDLVVDAAGEPVDRTRSAYGHAFVLLAYARAAAAGVDGAEADLERTHHLIEERFRDTAGMLRSDCGPDWTELEAYRGQNANMHACEAYLAAYEATEGARYLERARQLAETIAVDLATETDGPLWEHYTPNWEHDFTYNEDDPRHQFRPPGYQPGHHVEWAKFLGLLDRYGAGEGDGLYTRAHELFDAAVELGWTDDGFLYTVDRNGDPIVSDRYGWALAEAIGAAAVLAERADAHGDGDAADRFRRWEARLIDHTDAFRGPAGLWYERRSASEGGGPVVPEPPGVEPDYHPAGAYFESWRSLRKGA